jgi:hypothetical protein
MAGEDQIAGAGHESVFDDRRFANVLPLRRGEDDGFLSRFLAQAHVHHAAGRAVGVGIHDHGVDNTEDRGSRRDTQAEG